ncbi:MAG: hypothetical protein Q8P46_04865 [Hyphomicrobiales bacterium]|nr:hypothetical protein [Hyphomicrobiales bacterium]
MSGAFEGPGLIGGLVGLAFGVADWLIFTLLIVPKLEESARQDAWKGRKRATSLPVLRAAFLLSCFVALPIVGYVVGRLVLPNFGIAAGG